MARSHCTRGRHRVMCRAVKLQPEEIGADMDTVGSLRWPRYELNASVVPRGKTRAGTTTARVDADAKGEELTARAAPTPFAVWSQRLRASGRWFSNMLQMAPDRLERRSAMA